MEALSDRYGWTPDQIRQQRLEDIEQYLSILRVKEKIEKARARKR